MPGNPKARRVPWGLLLTVPLILGAAIAVCVVIHHFVRHDARVSADTEFARRFAGSLDLFGEFFSSRQRVLRGLADAISANQRTPSVPEFAQVWLARALFFGWFLQRPL